MKSSPAAGTLASRGPMRAGPPPTTAAPLSSQAIASGGAAGGAASGAAEGSAEGGASEGEGGGDTVGSGGDGNGGSGSGGARSGQKNATGRKNLLTANDVPSSALFVKNLEVRA